MRGLDAVGAQPFLHVGPLEDARESLIEPRDDFFRCARRRPHAVPARVLETRHLFADCRQLGYRRRALGGGYRQSAQFAGLDLRNRRRRRGEHELNLAAEQIGHRGAGALVGDVLHIGLGHLAEQFERQMNRAAGSARTKVERAWPGARQREEFFEVIRFDRRVHDQDQRAGGDQADRRDPLDRVVRQLVERRVGGVAGRYHDQGVAVWGGARDDLGADQTAGASAVVDDELLAELLRQTYRHHARNDIGAAARRKRHDHAHRFLGPFSSLSMCSRHGCGEHQQQQCMSCIHRCDLHST